MAQTLMTTIGGVRYRTEDARARGLLDDKNNLTATGRAQQAAFDEAYARRTRHDGTRRRGGVSNGRPASTARSSSSAPPAVEVPDGEPAEGWSVAQLDAYVAAAGVDVDAPGNKPEKLAAARAHFAAASGS